MNSISRRFLTIAALTVSISAGSFAADKAGTPLGQPGELVFSDDFNRTEVGKSWKAGIPAYEIADGALKGWQEREDHGSSIGATVPLKDGNAIVQLRFCFDGAKSINVNLDDKTYPGVHAGHIARVVLRPKNVTLYDDKEGVMRNDIYELRKSTDKAEKAKGDKLAEGRTKVVPVKLEHGQWYTLGVEIVDDAMRVSVDGEEIGRLLSSGLTHPRKSDLRIGVWGTSACVDDLQIWAVAK